MSDKDDPFGPGGKTVIQPMPGQGGQPQSPVRPAQPMRPAPGGRQWPTPGGAPQQWPTPGAGTPPYQAPVPGRGPAQVSQPDDWLRNSPSGAGLFPDFSPAPAAPPVAKIPLSVALSASDGGQISAANPITAAAAPLLILLGRLRLMIVDMQAVPLMQHVANEMQAFERKLLETGVPPADAQVAKYALCATADDIVQNLPGTDRHVWLQYSMVAQFFGSRTSGTGFYEELDRILRNPAPHYDLLELMHACLSLGFEGQYRGSQNGVNDLQRVRRDVYNALRQIRSRGDDDISPRWRGLDLKMPHLTTRLPLWAVGSAAAAILLGAYFVLRLMLGTDASAIASELVALHARDQVQLVRADYVPAVIEDTRDPTQLDRIRGRLSDQIAAGGVSVSGTNDSIVIRVANVLLFQSGKAEVSEDFRPLAVAIANALRTEPGAIRIVGHTDSVQPSGVGRFKSNQDLSVARAKAVEAVMSGQIPEAGRLLVEGRGEYDPLASNTTEEGRAQNRRVEIMIPREETLIKS